MWKSYQKSFICWKLVMKFAIMAFQYFKNFLLMYINRIEFEKEVASSR